MTKQIKQTLSYIVVSSLLGPWNLQAQNNIMVQPRPVQVASEWKPHVGILIGAAQPESSGITASEIAIDVGYQPYIPYGLAAEFSHARIDDGDTTQDRNIIWGKGSYHFGGTNIILKDSYVGLGLGAVFKPDGTSLALAPLLGFDLPLIESPEETISLGASLKYAIVGDSEVDTLSLSGVLKYWY